jgi:hypothetical protein
MLLNSNKSFCSNIFMNKTTKAIFLMLVVPEAAVLLSAIVVAEESMAWHTMFGSKKECVQFFKDVVGNTTRDSHLICQKIIPH